MDKRKTPPGDYDDTTSIGRLTDASCKEFLGTDVGVERDRDLATAINITPRLTSWLRGRFNTTSSFILSRSLTSRAPIQEFGDSGAYILPQTLNNLRSREIGITLDPSRGFRQLVKDSGATGQALRGLRVVDFVYRTTRLSTYDLATFDPDLTTGLDPPIDLYLPIIREYPAYEQLAAVYYLLGHAYTDAARLEDRHVPRACHENAKNHERGEHVARSRSVAVYE